MTQFKVGCSPLTSKIYAGPVLRNGTWGKFKHDVTDTAVGAVAQHLLQKQEKLQFEYKGKTYELKVELVKKDNKTFEVSEKCRCANDSGSESTKDGKCKMCGGSLKF